MLCIVYCKVSIITTILYLVYCYCVRKGTTTLLLVCCYCVRVLDAAYIELSTVLHCWGPGGRRGTASRGPWRPGPLPSPALRPASCSPSWMWRGAGADCRPGGLTWVAGGRGSRCAGWSAQWSSWAGRWASWADRWSSCAGRRGRGGWPRRPVRGSEGRGRTLGTPAARGHPPENSSNVKDHKI